MWVLDCNYSGTHKGQAQWNKFIHLSSLGLLFSKTIKGEMKEVLSPTVVSTKVFFFFFLCIFFSGF